MRRRGRFFYWAGLPCLAAVVWLWFHVREDTAEKNAPGQSASGPKTAFDSPSSATGPNAPGGGQFARSNLAALGTAGMARTGAAAPSPSRNPVPYRLSNTDQSLSQLGRSDTAILLENALIDTASPTPLAVPDPLRVSGDTGSYLVQWRRPLDNAFYDRLREVGAEFVSYIPNNAALVRVSADGARLLAAMSGTRA